MPKNPYTKTIHVDTYGLRLEMTCSACPEQYDVYRGEVVVGYMRLRHGYYYAETTQDGKTVYSANPKGDGIFEPEERGHFLTEGCRALSKALFQLDLAAIEKMHDDNAELTLNMLESTNDKTA